MANHTQKQKITRFLGLFFLSGFLFLQAGCGNYQKVLKGDKPEKKYELAKKLYDNEKYEKALPLFDDVLNYYRGSDKGRRILFYHAKSHYGIGSYKVAAFRFKNYYQTYSQSDKAEEALYMHAYCLYLQSPPVELDQDNTKKAINAFKTFITNYPESDKVSKANESIDELREKLKQKAYNRAYLWFKIYDYKAAITAFDNLLEDYPAIDNREKVEFLILKSRFKVAEKSVQAKKQSRYRKTVEKFRQFKGRYPDSKYLEEAKEIAKDSKKALKSLNS